jgi:SAM-dependent methyltransferase
MLEIGANPYFTTYLISKFRPEANLRLTNYFGGSQSVASQNVSVTGINGEKEEFHFEFLNANVEEHDVPLESGSLDVIIYAEVIEHMTNDPMRSLLELKRLLKPGGQLIVTTPNVARLENVARMISGTNIYDPYSGYGPYGRHNREYTRHELWKLMQFCGFSQEVFFTADVHDNHSVNFFDVEKISPLVAYRSGDLGQYLFSRWRNDKPAPDRLPSWLYRSYPDAKLDFSPL